MSGEPLSREVVRDSTCVFYGALQPADVRLLYPGDSSFPHDGCAALQRKYP
jgi:hypothetical protein